MSTANQLPFEQYPQQPHGGTLVNQVVPEHLRAAEIARARELPSIRVDLEAVITFGLYHLALPPPASAI